MLDCISVENMRCSDAETIARGVSGLELMYRAARGVFLANSWTGAVAIVAGSGNNGGDGYALACILHREQIPCTLFTVSSRLSADSAHYAAQAAALKIPILPLTPGCLTGFATVVDCLLGTGFQGPLRQHYRHAIEQINIFSGFVVSVDINSGMNGDTGEGELIVRSDLTVTIGFVKQGLVTENAGRFLKRLVCVDIGINLSREEQKLCTPDETHPNALPCPHWLDTNILVIL